CRCTGTSVGAGTSDKGGTRTAGGRWDCRPRVSVPCIARTALHVRVSGNHLACLICCSLSRCYVRVLIGHSGCVHAVAYSNDGTMLASLGVDGTLRLWDMASGVESDCLAGRGSRSTPLVFAPHEHRLATVRDS